jgi:hypothetical protein
MDRAALIAACGLAFAEVRAARGTGEVLPAIELACRALADLALSYPASEWNDHAVDETRAILARLGTFRQLARDIQRIG